MELTIVEARANLADALNRVAYGGERIVLKRNGKSVAAIVSMDELNLLERYEDEQDIKAARKALAEPGFVPWEQVKARLKAKRRRPVRSAKLKAKT
jgi:prevent-host-death family protein